jgi:hypothetical protein
MKKNNVKESKFKLIMLEEYTKNILHILKESCSCMQQQHEKDKEKEKDKNYNPQSKIDYQIHLDKSGSDEPIIVIPTGLIITHNKTREDYKVISIGKQGVEALPPNAAEQPRFISKEMLKDEFHVK